MIHVSVGKENEINFGQLGSCKGGSHQTLGSDGGKAEICAHPGEQHRVRQHGKSEEINEHGRVPEPGERDGIGIPGGGGRGLWGSADGAPGFTEAIANESSRKAIGRTCPPET